jgi:hypothetical protein
MEKNKEPVKNAHLDVTLQLKNENGILIEISTKCDTWKNMQKFLNDFENTLLKGNNGKT